jgi:predicted secreted protein
VDQVRDVGERPVLGRDAEVVRDVVAEVRLRAVEERRDPEGLDAEIVQVIEAPGDAGEIADAVAVRVGERPRSLSTTGGSSRCSSCPPKS